MELIWSADAADDLGSPMAARQLFESIIEKAQLFADFPGAATVLRTQTGIDTGYRYMASGNWMVFFSPEDTQALVVRVLYGKSDYMKTLFGEMDSED